MPKPVKGLGRVPAFPPLPTGQPAEPGPLSPHRLVAKVADHPVPPPHEPPMADSAPEALVAFLYYLVRDLIPPRYIDSILHHARAGGAPMPDDHIRGFAERVARELVYELPEVTQ